MIFKNRRGQSEFLKIVLVLVIIVVVITIFAKKSNLFANETTTIGTNTCKTTNPDAKCATGCEAGYTEAEFGKCSTKGEICCKPKTKTTSSAATQTASVTCEQANGQCKTTCPINYFTNTENNLCPQGKVCNYYHSSTNTCTSGQCCKVQETPLTALPACASPNICFTDDEQGKTQCFGRNGRSVPGACGANKFCCATA